MVNRQGQIHKFEGVVRKQSRLAIFRFGRQHGQTGRKFGSVAFAVLGKSLHKFFRYLVSEGITDDDSLFYS